MTRIIISFIIITVLAVLISITVLEMPQSQSFDKPSNNYVYKRYTQNVLEDTGVLNMVTAVLIDYRGFDTFGEATVLFAASIAVASILKKSRNGKR